MNTIKLTVASLTALLCLGGAALTPIQVPATSQPAWLCFFIPCKY